MPHSDDGGKRQPFDDEEEAEGEDDYELNQEQII